ncbi:hypothetical protein [Streptomyces sp. NBC_01471]
MLTTRSQSATAPAGATNTASSGNGLEVVPRETHEMIFNCSPAA